MTVNAVDATGLSPSQIAVLAKNGVKTVGRYLSHSSWKALTLGEVANLKAAGMQIFSIYESNPTHASYFTADKGKTDALDAINLAKCVGQPEDSAIYFTVDYDARACDLEAILAYFQAVKSNLSGYKVGGYGSYTVLNYLHEHNAADYWFQTVAWSNSQRCSFNNIYQFQCDKTLAGVSVDFDNLETADFGAWDQPRSVQDVKPDSVGKNGWIKENNVWYYYNNNVMVKDAWEKDHKGLWYYLGDDGAMVASKWVKWKDKWYYLKSDGSMATGVVEDKGKLYYLDNTGAMISSGRVNVSLSVADDGSLHP